MINLEKGGRINLAKNNPTGRIVHSIDTILVRAPLETPVFEKPTTQNEGVTRIALLKI